MPPSAPRLTSRPATARPLGAPSAVRARSAATETRAKTETETEAEPPAKRRKPDGPTLKLVVVAGTERPFKNYVLWVTTEARRVHDAVVAAPVARPRREASPTASVPRLLSGLNELVYNIMAAAWVPGWGSRAAFPPAATPTMPRTVRSAATGVPAACWRASG